MILLPSRLMGQWSSLTCHWYDKAFPTYSVDMVYRLGGLRLSVTPDSSIFVFPAADSFSVGEKGYYLTSRELFVEHEGMSLSFERSMEIHPSQAERYAESMSTERPIFPLAFLHQEVNIVDARSGATLRRNVDFRILRSGSTRGVSDTTVQDHIAVDLSGCAGHHIRVVALLVVGYGPARGGVSDQSKPVLSVPTVIENAPRPRIR